MASISPFTILLSKIIKTDKKKKILDNLFLKKKFKNKIAGIVKIRFENFGKTSFQLLTKCAKDADKEAANGL
jgi:predicted hydrolase (HD superfamily)